MMGTDFKLESAGLLVLQIVYDIEVVLEHLYHPINMMMKHTILYVLI